MATTLLSTATGPWLAKRHRILKRSRVAAASSSSAGGKPSRCQPDREEAARQLARLGDGLVEVIRDSSRRPGLRTVRGTKLTSQGVGVESQAHQMLAEAVVNVLADAGLLPVADFQ